MDIIKYKIYIRPPRDLPLTLMLIRLSYPYSYVDFLDAFGRSPGYLLVVYNTVCIHLNRRFDRIIDWYPYLIRSRLKYYASILDAKGDGRGII